MKKLNVSVCLVLLLSLFFGIAGVQAEQNDLFSVGQFESFRIDSSGNVVQEGATADAYETTIGVADPTADRTITWPDASGTPLLSTAAQGAAAGVTIVANGIEFEGATANAFETTVSVTDPTTPDKSIVIPDASGTVMLSSLATNGVDVANAVTGASNALLFEGATADAFELSLSPADVGADLTVTLPTSTAAVATMYTALTTNSVDVANSVTGVSNGLLFEGATADAFEMTISPADVGVDVAVTLPTSTAAVAPIWTALTTNSVDVANSVTGVSNGFQFEGATADAFETTLSPTDVGADATITLPTKSGTLQASGAVVALTPGATPTLTVVAGRQVFTYQPADNTDATFNASGAGSAGDVMVFIFTTDAAGSQDEVMTFGTNIYSTGTLTMANLASDIYVVSFVSNGTAWVETGRTIVQTT